MRINDYRPISCCNVLYKCISRIISNRLKDSLTNLVNLNQSAFILGRCISDNILLTQELMHNYHLDRSTPRCAFKGKFPVKYRAGLGLSATVSDIVDQGLWCWPPDWSSKYPRLANVNVHNLTKARDRIVWRHITDDDSDFSVAKVWDCIRPRANEVNWFHIVWFSHQIPRHVIHLWLVMRRKLKTQDTLRQRDNHLKSFTSLSNIPSDLNSIVDFFILLAKMRSTRSVVSKLVFAASTYFIWQERNNRLFMKTLRTKDQVINVIMSTIRLKLLTCKFKKTKNVENIIHLWKLPTSMIL
ncbi:reverse transcriptase domain, reverse transcriptase zinc-binding domain protein [Tanacetum coccineum]